MADTDSQSVRVDRTSTRRSDADVTMRIAEDAVRKAREGFALVKRGMLAHEKARLRIEPLSQVDLAIRALEEVRDQIMRGVG